MSRKRKAPGRHRETLRSDIATALDDAMRFERVVVGALLGQPELAATVNFTAADMLHAAPEIVLGAIAQLQADGTPVSIAEVDREIERRGYERPDIVWLVECLDYAGTPTWTPGVLQRLIDLVQLRAHGVRELSVRDEIAGRLAAGADLDYVIERLIALRDGGAAPERAT